ncbi:DUF1783-domain-containing protein [Athelia psychrophila]|uniref:DUF1783-domain-containing protein n=1 Tax=Athelia psychrophila TaxID=1759441 RepID=A0A166S6J2_9AGAM|nr:DUF1783-domain-containing protein [Fibularhizoctonia sp. CBS 109695]
MSSILRQIPSAAARRAAPRISPSFTCRSYAKKSSKPPGKPSGDADNVKTFSAKSRPPPPSAQFDFKEQVEVRAEDRGVVTETLPRPPPPTPEELEQPAKVFRDASQPRPYGARRPAREGLPLQKKVWPIIVAFIAAGVAGWAGFLLVATNQEKISSSVVRQIMRTVRDNEELRDMLGEAIRPAPEWWLNGDPWIEGAINMLQGNIDLSFRLKGHKGSGTLYFTSVRKAKGESFTILRFRVRGDDGTVVNIPTNSAS